MKLGVLMDPLSTLNHKKDTTLVFLARAHELGFTCYYFTLQDLFCQDGRAFARVSSIVVEGKETPKIKTQWIGDEPLGEFDMILMRKDPPFDMEYIYATYILELAEMEGVTIANHPQSLRDANEKFLTLYAPNCCPPTLVTRDMGRLHDFWKEHQQVIFKPLAGMGGRSVFYVGEDGHNLSVILELLTQSESETIMAQRFIEDIKTTGDKRILLIDGEPVPFGLARFPKEGEHRCNLASGGHGEVVPITTRERFICSEIAPLLRSKKLSFVGIDVIGGYLTEINVTSPTCLREIEQETGLDISGDYLRYLAGLSL
ncbi:MAG: glutathione synthase [Legionellaceae bacterium]